MPKIKDEELSDLEREEDTFRIGENEVKKRYTFSEDTLEDYRRIGLVDLPRPHLTGEHTGIFPYMKPGDPYDGRMPVTLKQLSLDQVSAMLSLSFNWHSYISAQYSMTAAKRSEAKKKKEAVWSIVRNAYRRLGRSHGVTYTDQRLSDFARQDKRFVEVDAEYERYNALYEALYNLIELTQKEMDVISREVTIRQAKMEGEATSRRLGGRFSSHTESHADERRKMNGPTQRGSLPEKVRKNFARPKFKRDEDESDEDESDE